MSILLKAVFGLWKYLACGQIQMVRVDFVKLICHKARQVVDSYT